MVVELFQYGQSKKLDDLGGCLGDSGLFLLLLQ